MTDEGLLGGNINNKNRIRFVDHPGISQFFPAYLRHKDKWDEFKWKWITAKQLEGIIKGNINYNWWKEYIRINNDQNQTDREIDANKEKNVDVENNDINFKIEDKDKVISVNIKNKKKISQSESDDTVQRSIENSWE